MKKKKTMLAVAAAAALSIMLSSMPGAFAAENNPAYTTSSTVGETTTTATNWNTIAIAANTPNYFEDNKDTPTPVKAKPASNPYTKVKKILEIEDDSSIPAASFTITASAPTADIAGDATHLPVKKGPNPEKITWKAVDVGHDNDSDPYRFTSALNDASTTDTAASYTIAYAANNPTGNVSVVAANSPITTITDDNVLISAGKDGTYYAEKEVQLDFSGCLFTEPGVYRYILTETGTNTGVTNDTTGVVGGNPTRTIDVYVQDATYYTRTGDAEPYTYTINPKLAITGYVMYVGTVNTAPLKEGSDESDESDEVTLEDGTTSVTPNGAEVASTTKSVGFKNTYKTNKLKITKTVTGNQGSRDQYFKFTLKSNTADNDKISDNAVFYVSKDTADTSISNNLSAVNSATNATYTVAIINEKNTFTTPATGMDTTKILGTFTGSQLKAGVDFYLQHDQYITVTGLPTGIGYTVTEVGEDYKVEYTAAAGTDKITADVLNTETSTYTGTDITATNQTGEVSATDSLLRADAQVDFTNTKEGVIPTGVILSVAAPVIIGIIAAAGIIAIFMRKRRKAD
ncbi:MAG: hypothetical protein IKP75_03260 [Oscillospiraceae bacterium]|nr:hypothetical protein [Oscillospiraceae bacterium]